MMSFVVDGAAIARALWRRTGLQKDSMYSKIADASSARVVQIRRSSSSICIEPKDDSIIALMLLYPSSGGFGGLGALRRGHIRDQLNRTGSPGGS